MSGQIVVAATIRSFIRTLYAETASSVNQVYEEDALTGTLRLSQVKVCCGTDSINRTGDGYVLPIGTPWLVELYFGNDPGQKTTPETTVDLLGSATIGTMTLRNLQGTGPVWSRKFAATGIASIGQLAACPHETVIELSRQYASRRVFEFHAKALVAVSPAPPVPRSTIDGYRFFDLLEKGPEEISVASETLSRKEAERLLRYLAGLAAVLDNNILGKMTLRDILP